MTLRFYTDDAQAVLTDMIRLVGEAGLESSSPLWRYDIETGFNHTGVQWDRVGSFVPHIDNAQHCVTFEYVQGQSSDKAVSNTPEYLHGRFVEFLLIYFTPNMKQVVLE